MRYGITIQLKNTPRFSNNFNPVSCILINFIPMQSPQQVANAWFDAFNKHDIEMLLSLYAADAEHYSPKLKARQPETNGLIKGKPALRAWWTDAFTRLPNLHYKVLQLMATDSRVFMEYIRQTPGEEDLQVGEVLDIENGKIIASRVYHS